VVIRTLNLGHVFPQGTADSNEIWVDFKATADGKEIGRSGALKRPGTDLDSGDDSGEVDKWAHFTNVWMLDRHGNRIDRRNPQDIFAPLYDHQIPPGAANVVHYRLDVPADVKGPVELSVRLRYRKFDYRYMDLVHKPKNVPVPKLPIVDLCSDTVTLPVDGGSAVTAQESPVKPAWQRWNDYGIACYIEAGPGSKRGQTKQAEAAFKKLLSLNVPEAMPHGHINLARIYIDDGRLDAAAAELEEAKKYEPQKFWWKLAWFGALVNSETGRDLDAAISDLKKIVDPGNRDPDAKKDFTRDIVVLNTLASIQFKKASGETGAEQAALLREVIETAERAQAIDQEDAASHDRLWRCYTLLGKRPNVTVAAPEATGDALTALAGTLADANVAKPARLEAAAKLLAGLEAFMAIAGDVYPPRLPTLRSLILTLRPAYHAEEEPEVKGALASVLAALHAASVSIYKVDEVARSYATTQFRAQPGTEAANYAARERIIYPTTARHREMILKTGNLGP
jgi:tetratricopeptide (TPR) repeat protein